MGSSGLLGIVSLYPGFTPDMTYMAVGEPDSKETKQTKDGKAVEFWTYKKFYPSGHLEAVLTDYSRARNPNLLRSLDIETGDAHTSVHAPVKGYDPSTPNPETTHGSGTGTAGSMGSLSLPDVPVYNLYIIFLEGKIVDLRMESLDGTPL